jgi:hypothetical protein
MTTDQNLINYMYEFVKVVASDNEMDRLDTDLQEWAKDIVSKMEAK